MESLPREALLMKSFEEQTGGGGELIGSDANHQPLTSINNSIPSLAPKSLDSELFHQESTFLEPIQFCQPLSPSKSIAHESVRTVTVTTTDGFSSLPLSCDISTRVKNQIKPSNSMCGTEMGTNNDAISLLHPPQSGLTKVKRGPGRPRKDSLNPGKSPRPPTAQKHKSLIPGVRGRKKLESVFSIGLSNSALFNSGDISIGESPPRGTDDTAESDTSSVSSSLEKLQDDFSMFPELWPGKVCGFCNLGERSMLGQGDLLRIEIPESFDAIAVSKMLSPKSRIERENSIDKCQKPGLFSRRQKGSGKMKKLISQSSLESLNEPVDEICGHMDEVEYSSIFDITAGFYYVHYSCSLWCDGVTKSDDGSFKNLEMEIVRSLSQRCHHCGNLGAGLMCNNDGCNVLLHFPCAALSGAFQDPSTHKVLCSSHIDALQLSGNFNAICTVCHSKGEISSLIMCSSCGCHYHGTCMALNCDPVIRVGWLCPACKICQACRQPGDETKLLACDTCDKTYHIFCLRPALSSIPKHSWKCKMCRMCTDCGARTPGSGPSSRWHANFSVCDSCYQQRNKGLACPLCGRAYRHVAQKLMLQCSRCRKYVHGTCDPAADLAIYQQRKELYPDYEYICIPCKAAGTGLNTSGGNPRVLSALKRSDEIEENINQSICATSQDSIFSIEDDSFPGTESSNDLIWLEKNLSTSLNDIKPQLPHQTHFLSKDKSSIGLDKLHKKKLIPGRIKPSEKIGSNLTHPNGRKTRFNEFAKKRGPKPKLRLFGNVRVNNNRNSTDLVGKLEDEPGVENRMVLCSARDEFVLQQDVCVMCGALGNDFEGRLISCAQCGQCYHPFCVKIKVTKVVLQKGWRCLDCTVCEGCGQRNDESRLILCDECDVSFHIYCIDPPLEQVPDGPWKCKWCAVCHYCGSSESRYNSCWHENYTKCGPCASENHCPVCNSGYCEDDLIIKCFKCERWLHGQCDMIKDVEEAEKCAEGGYVCILCRPSDVLPFHLRPIPKPITPKREPLPIAPDSTLKANSQFLVDGIYLSEYGVKQIKSLTMELPRKKRKKAPNIADLEAGIIAAIESVVAGDDKSKDDKEKEKDPKKRHRNIHKLGIGGFLVRLRAPRYKDEDFEPTLDQPGGTLDGDKPKRKPARRKIKNKLMESFPTYMQEAFFGKSLMDSNKDFDHGTNGEIEPELLSSLKLENTVKLSKEIIHELESIKSRQKQAESSLGSLPEDKKKDNLKHAPTSIMDVNNCDAAGLPDMLAMSSDLLDNDLVDTIMNEKRIKVEDGTTPRRSVLDGSAHLQLNRTTTDDNHHKDELTDFLSSQFIDSIDQSGLPSMDSKDVEDIFKGVLVDDSQEPLFPLNPQSQQTPRIRPVIASTPSSGTTGVIPAQITQQPVVQGSSSVPRTVTVQQNLASPVSFPPPSPYHSEYSNSPQFSPAFSEPPSPWPAPVEDVDQPSSYNQRSILKWEADEGLGHQATISAVLYANINHPELKRDYASWAERSKQISKIWRGLPSEKRAPYLQKARENRAACRMQKAQQDQDKIINIAQTKPRGETQEERQWKQLQAIRHQQQHASLQESQGKEGSIGGVNTPHTHHSFTPALSRPGVNETPAGIDAIRSPLHVSTPHEAKSSPLQSPQVQSPSPKLPVSVSMPSNRPSSLEMAPPSPMFGPRTPGPSMQPMRSPVFTRAPFVQSTKPISSSSETYGSMQVSDESCSQLPLRSFSETDVMATISDSTHFNPKMPPTILDSPDAPLVSRPTASPQGQETRQHLRDLLQRQQVKKLEQDQMNSNSMDSQSVQRQIWTSEDWQKSPGLSDGSQMIRHPGAIPPGQNMHINQFRQPYLPTHSRMSTPIQQGPHGTQSMSRPGDFRMSMGKPGAPPQSITGDMRNRMMINQQRVVNMNNLRHPQTFHGTPTNQFQASRNPLDPYGHLVVQQQRMQGGGIVTSSSMLAQQLGRPLQTMVGCQPTSETITSHSSPQQMQTNATLQQQMASTQSLSDAGLGAQNQLPAEHQELPDSVTAELEKLEQEQHNDNKEDITSELEDLGMDDDDLLGMGADFNILEYADPELDQAVGGEKTNILDNLDLEEEDKDENKEQKRKEEVERGAKKENAENSGKPVKPLNKQSESAEAHQTNPEMSATSNANFNHVPPGHHDNVQSMLRPAAPPPPYPGPPPPYPGRAQMGIRNGCCGLSVNVPSVLPLVGAKNSSGGYVGGGRPSFSSVSSSTMLSHSNPHLSLQQRRTLLLQEQPLLLEDLLEQEKREQLRQGTALIGAAPEEPLLSDFDFERLKADVLSSSALPVSLSPPNVVGILRNQPGTQEWQIDSDVNIRRPDQHIDPNINIHHSTTPVTATVTIGNQPPIGSTTRVPTAPLQSLPPPPNPPEHPANEQERQMQNKYEQWLYAQQQVLSMHQKCFETEVNKLRKIKKSINSKLRQLKKNGNELNDTDTAELDRVGKELPGLQKQLDQARKQSRQHNILMQDYRTKQQKRQQQMMGMSPGGQGNGPQGGMSTQASPAASSPLHSTPQSPMLSPSPSMGGPSPSPLMQHSPMASPLTPSPGPSAMTQNSPRGVMNTGVHLMDDTPFSPGGDSGNRSLTQNLSPSNRMPQHQMTQFRMSSPATAGHQIIQSGGINVNQSPNVGMMINRGMNPNMMQMQHRSMVMTDNQCNMPRLRAGGPQDHMRNINPMGQRFQRMGMNQDMLMRSRPPSNFTNQSSMGMNQVGQHFNVSRVPFPSQSPTGSTNLRSPSPMVNLGSPPNQNIMQQNRVSPSSSPMRRPSGSGSIGSASPMADRPPSIENPLTPRNTGSRSHTPSGNIVCQITDQHQMHQQHGPPDGQLYNSPETCNSGNMGNSVPLKMHNFVPGNEYQNQNQTTANEFNQGGGGGGNNPHILPFPTFSWYDGPFKLGLKGGSPFSVVTDNTAVNPNPVTEQNPGTSSTTSLPIVTSNSESTSMLTDNMLDSAPATVSQSVVNNSTPIPTQTLTKSVDTNLETIEQKATDINSATSCITVGQSIALQSNDPKFQQPQNTSDNGNSAVVVNCDNNDSKIALMPLVPSSIITKEILTSQKQITPPPAEEVLKTANAIASMTPAQSAKEQNQNTHTQFNSPSTESFSTPENYDSKPTPVPTITSSSIASLLDAPTVANNSSLNHNTEPASHPKQHDTFKCDQSLTKTILSSTIKIEQTNALINSVHSEFQTSNIQNVQKQPSGIETTPASNLPIVAKLETNSQEYTNHNSISMQPKSLTTGTSTPLHSSTSTFPVISNVTVAESLVTVSNYLTQSQMVHVGSTLSNSNTKTLTTVSTFPKSTPIVMPSLMEQSSEKFANNMESSQIKQVVSVSLPISIQSSPIMHTILAQPQRPLSQPSPLHSIANSSFVQIPTTNTSATTGESQNALLKQLLQNTGCASTAQTSENVGFSLTSCLQARAVNPMLHTSHLSEAATRIPQPTPLLRPPRPPIIQPSIRPIIKAEVVEESELLPVLIQPSNLEEEQTPQAVSVETTFDPPEVSTPTPTEDVIHCTVNSDVKESLEIGSVEPPLPVTVETSVLKSLDAKKLDDEAKKGKRRQYQSKRKQTVGKEAAVVTKKRPRKVTKPEEDFDAFIENFMIQLRQLPPIAIVEPNLGLNYNSCPIQGSGDFSKINNKGYSTRLGDMIGEFGYGVVKSCSDYYSTKPFGTDSTPPVQKSSPSHRGFYNQEFAAPKTSQHGDKPRPENRTPTPIRECDTPDTIVSSSSPECSRDSPDLYPGLKLIETDEDKLIHLRDSPVISIACPIPIRPLLAAKLAKATVEADKENSSGKSNILSGKGRSTGHFKENGNITVTLTLSATAVDDIRGVLRNLANMLSIDTPACQIEKVYSPPDKKLFTFKPKDTNESVDLQSILNGTFKFCKHCDVLILNNIVKKKATDIPGNNFKDPDSIEEFYFCTTNCYVQFSMSHGVSVSASDDSPTVVKHINDVKSTLKSMKHDTDSGAMKNSVKQNTRRDSNLLTDHQSSLKRPLSDNENLDSSAPPAKTWKNIRYKKFSGNTVLQNKYKKPSEKEMTEMLFRLGITVLPNKIPDDTRRCVLCHQIGDAVSDGPGRLLNYDVDKWIHLNCALWSEEVYETENGALMNVEQAYKQSMTIACVLCNQNGASVKCFKVRCTSVYHVGCAVKEGCAFYKNKSVYCPVHIPKGEKENELTSLSVFRRVYVHRDENRQVAVVMHHGDQHHLLRVGSLIFLNVGQLLPHQLHAFHTRNYIYPVGYKIVRFYWSMIKANKRCQYICSIHENDGKPEFRITAQEEGCKEQIVKSSSAQGAWFQVLEAVSRVRIAQDCIKVFPRFITGEDLFGLTEPAIVKVLESLPGIETLTDYNFKYGRNPLLELPLAINPSGCARSEPKLRTHFKKPHTQRTGASRSALPSCVLSSSEAACPYSKQFVHSKSSQYKKMKQEWRNNVYLARSKIQGLGLYAARDIEKHTMVIEYIGEIIRNELAELREKKYEAQNRGIYMFRMDDERVIDATLCGGLARYVNHSCNPNCVAETVEVDRDLRIIIFANRRISRGEELAYDYKFEVEDDQHKIPCLCGAHNCQQWMN